jgi:hypothetical protein
MFAQHKFPRFALVLILLIGLCAGLFAPKVADVEAKPYLVYPATSVVISEFRFRGDGAGNDEFVELYNPTSSPIDISGWLIRGSNNAGTTGTRATIPLLTILQPGQYYLIAHTGYSGPTSADLTYVTGITDDGGVAITLSDTTTIIDQVGLSAGSAYKEGTNQIALTTNVDRGYERYIGGINGNCQDDANNFPDFVLINPSNPQNSSTIILCGTPTETPSPTHTSTNTFTPTTTFTPTNTPIFSLTPSLTPAPGQVIISEVAWAGTRASPDDEWIELYNTRPWPIDLTGWRLVNINGTVDILLNGTIPANGFFLLERGSNQTVSNVTANQIYTGALADTNDLLRLRKPDGTIIDTANANSGSWPAGGGANAASMERYLSGSTPSTDNDFGWLTGVAGTGLDATGVNFIYGTPGGGNLAFTVTPTFTPIVTSTSTPAGTRSVIINEVAWAGTASGLADDEWIELYNTTNVAINITGWRITASDGTPNISLVGIIPARGYFLLERGANVTDDTTVSDIPADQIYTGNALSNSGEALTLYDSANRIIDTANGNGGAWPAGSGTTYGTMERILNSADSDSAWITNNGTKRNGRNANGGNILGTPKNSNSVGPTPTPSRAPTITFTPTLPIDSRPIINEILARPGFDWNQDGGMDVYDEFIEIKNLSPIDINLRGWKIDKLNGATIFNLPDVTLKPNERIVFYSQQSNLLLSDGGETIRLINPSGKIYDAYTYTVAKEADKSFCRLPDGNVYGNWFEDCIPTPNLTNTREGKVPTSPDGNTNSCDLPDTIPADFFFAECGGYGAKIWNPFYWDDLLRIWLQNNNNKWETFIE